MSSKALFLNAIDHTSKRFCVCVEMCMPVLKGPATFKVRGPSNKFNHISKVIWYLRSFSQSLWWTSLWLNTTKKIAKKIKKIKSCITIYARYTTLKTISYGLCWLLWEYENKLWSIISLSEPWHCRNFGLRKENDCKA